MYIIPITVLYTIKYILNPICLYLGRTSLMLNGKTDAMRILLEHGADVNAKDEQGKLHTEG